MHPSFKAGIIGAGLMGRWHAHAVERLGGGVAAILDQDLEAAQRLAARVSRVAPIVSADLSLIHEAEVDAWHICTPLASHATFCRAALDAGCHVLVEKPLVVTARETGVLLEQAALSGRLLCPVHQFPFQEGVARTGQGLSGLGMVSGFHYFLRSAGGEGLDPQRVDAIAADILPHPLSLIAHFWPGALPLLAWQASRAAPGEWLASAQEGGVTYTINISMAGRPTLNRCEIVAATGTLYLDLFHGYGFVEAGDVSRTRKLLQPFSHSSRQFSAAAGNLGRRLWRREPAYPGLQSLIGSFYAAVNGQGPPPISPATSLAIAEARERILQERAANA